MTRHKDLFLENSYSFMKWQFKYVEKIMKQGSVVVVVFAKQGLQSELQDLGFRADNIEHFLNESQEHFDKLENMASCIEGQDR